MLHIITNVPLLAKSKTIYFLRNMRDAITLHFIIARRRSRGVLCFRENLRGGRSLKHSPRIPIYLKQMTKIIIWSQFPRFSVTSDKCRKNQNGYKLPDHGMLINSFQPSQIQFYIHAYIYIYIYIFF